MYLRSYNLTLYSNVKHVNIIQVVIIMRQALALVDFQVD